MTMSRAVPRDLTVFRSLTLQCGWYWRCKPCAYKLSSFGWEPTVTEANQAAIDHARNDCPHVSAGLDRLLAAVRDHVGEECA